MAPADVGSGAPDRSSNMDDSHSIRYDGTSDVKEGADVVSFK